MNNPIIFYFLSASILIFAGLTIKFKNIFYSLLSAMMVFLLAGILFYTLGSEYNAIVQIAIYGLAVPVILGVAVMFTNVKNYKNKKISGKLKSVMFLVCGLFILAMFYLVLTSILFRPEGFHIVEEFVPNSAEVIQAFSRGIFVKYVWAFELVSLILTITAVGLTLFKRREGK